MVLRVKVLKRDCRAVDALIGIFVFIATFIIITAVILELMQETITAEARGNFSLNKGPQIIGSESIYFLDPEGGVNITEPSDYRDTWKHDADESTYFSDPALTGDTIEAQVIVDNTEYSYSGIRGSQENLYTDYIMLACEWGWWSWDEIAISFGTVIANQIEGTNTSMTYFELHDGNYSLVITTIGDPEYFHVFMFDAKFNMRIGIPESATRDDMQDASMWTILRQLLTASLPDVEPVTNYLISVPIWSCIGFMAVMIVRAFIPFLGG